MHPNPEVSHRNPLPWPRGTVQSRRTRATWRAPPWHTAVVCRAADIASARARLPVIAQLGATVLELAGPACAGALDDPAGAASLVALRDAAHEHRIALTLALAAEVSTAAQASATIGRALRALECYGLDGLSLEGGLLLRGTRAARVRAAIAAAVRRGCARERPIYLTLGAPSEPAGALPSGIPAGYDARWHPAVGEALHAILAEQPSASVRGARISPHQRLCRALAQGIEPSVRATAAIVGLKTRPGRPDPAALAAARALLLLGPAAPQLALDPELDAAVLAQCRRLLAVRRRDLVPLLPGVQRSACVSRAPGGAFAVDWLLADGSALHLLANLTPTALPAPRRPAGRLLFATHPNIRAAVARNELEPWSVTWLLERSVGR